MCLCQAQAENSLETDVCVYGGTLGGITAALAAARRRSDVVMNEPLRHLGALVFKEEYLAFQEVKKANPDWANKLKERRTQPQR
jgi:flavin-dependent dehydrogenase